MTQEVNQVAMDQEVLEHEEAERKRLESTEAAMRQAGVPVDDAVQADYFACDEVHSVPLPDGISFVEHTVLSEGGRRKYQNETNKDVRLSRTSGDAYLKLQTGEERHALLMEAITGWNLVKAGVPVVFSKGSPGSTLGQWLEKAPPAVVDIVYKDVVKKNPWLMAEMSLEDIDKQIAELKELRETKAKEEEGNAS